MPDIEQITLGQLAVALAFVLALVSAVRSLRKTIKEGLESVFDKRFKEIEKTQNDILQKIKDVDMENCKNYLVTFLAEVERGEPKDEIEIERFHEQYDHYIANNGNSYVKEKVNYLKEKKALR